MVDYGAFPVWDISRGYEDSMVRAESLAISDELKAHLAAWGDEWTEKAFAALESESDLEEAELTQRGRQLAHRLARELAAVEIVYWPGGPEDQEVITP